MSPRLCRVQNMSLARACRSMSSSHSYTSCCSQLGPASPHSQSFPKVTEALSSVMSHLRSSGKGTAVVSMCRCRGAWSRLARACALLCDGMALLFDPAADCPQSPRHSQMCCVCVFHSYVVRSRSDVRLWRWLAARGRLRRVRGEKCGLRFPGKEKLGSSGWLGGRRRLGD